MRAPWVHAPNENHLPACDRAGRNAALAGLFSGVTCPLCLRFPELWIWTVRAADRIYHQWVRKITEAVFRAKNVNQWLEGFAT